MSFINAHVQSSVIIGYNTRRVFYYIAESTEMSNDMIYCFVLDLNTL